MTKKRISYLFVSSQSLKISHDVLIYQPTNTQNKENKLGEWQKDKEFVYNDVRDAEPNNGTKLKKLYQYLYINRIKALF